MALESIGFNPGLNTGGAGMAGLLAGIAAPKNIQAEQLKAAALQPQREFLPPVREDATLAAITPIVPANFFQIDFAAEQEDGTNKNITLSSVSAKEDTPDDDGKPARAREAAAKAAALVQANEAFEQANALAGNVAKTEPGGADIIAASLNVFQGLSIVA